MSIDKRDSALSEVIGLILIIAIVVAVMSVYVVYMVPEKGKASEIRHMNEVRASFLELAYLIDSLWVNGQVGVSVAVPFRLHSTAEPTIIPLFTPVSSQGMLSIRGEGEAEGTFTIEFQGFNEERIFFNPPEPDRIGELTLETVTREPYKVWLDFTPLLSPTNHKEGHLAKLVGESNGVAFEVNLDIRNFILNTTATLQGGDTIEFTNTYRHSLVAIDERSKLEYVVIHDIKVDPTNPLIGSHVTVDIKPVLDLFPGAMLVKGSRLRFIPDGGLESPEGRCAPTNSGTRSCDQALTFSYGLQYNVDVPASEVDPVTVTQVTTSSLSDLTFTAGNYYWVDQAFQYQKGAVFLIQDYLDTGVRNVMNSSPLSDAQIRISNTTSGDPILLSTVDININRKDTSRLSTSGGSAQVITEITKIEHILEDKNADIGEDVRIKYNAVDGTANAAVFTVTSTDEDTLRRWFNMFGRMCNVADACKRGQILPDLGNPGQVTLTVHHPDERIWVQYTKVDLDMEIRP